MSLYTEVLKLRHGIRNACDPKDMGSRSRRIRSSRTVWATQALWGKTGVGVDTKQTNKQTRNAAT